MLNPFLVCYMIQFYMKLEEKLHAKEAEMNQIQAKTQVRKKFSNSWLLLLSVSALILYLLLWYFIMSKEDCYIIRRVFYKAKF